MGSHLKKTNFNLQFTDYYIHVDEKKYDGILINLIPTVWYNTALNGY